MAGWNDGGSGDYREFLDNKVESENDVSDRNVGDMERVTNEHNQDS